MHSVGITEEETYRKSDIARAQLVEAINNFIAEKFLLSISLSWSAEEILAGLLRVQGKKPVIEHPFKQIERLRDETGLSVACKK